MQNYSVQGELGVLGKIQERIWNGLNNYPYRYRKSIGRNFLFGTRKKKERVKNHTDFTMEHKHNLFSY